MKNIVVLTKNIHTRQTPSSAEYKLNILKFYRNSFGYTQSASSLWNEIDDQIMNSLVITAFKTRYRNMRDSVIVSACL